jgi:hypothetical protein
MSAREVTLSARGPSRLVALIVLALAVCAAGAANAQKWPADAEECRWFGTAPLCDGECPAGWRIENYSGAGCVGTWGISGTKAFCCKIKPKCGPANYGTEGCPYPSFGGCKPGWAQGTILGRTVCCRPGQEFVAHVGCREPKPKETPPQDTSSDPVVKQLPHNSDILKKFDPTGGCGQGMYKGGDGQCYPKLN